MMKWSSVRDKVVESTMDRAKCWLVLDREEKVTGIYIKIDEVSKFVPNEPWEETLEGAKFRAEFEVARFFEAVDNPKPRRK